MSSPDTLTYTGCACSGDYIIYTLFSSPKKQTLDLNKYIFVCDFEVDYCGLALFGTWHRGLKTETEDTGPSRGASNSCKPIYRILPSNDPCNTYVYCRKTRCSCYRGSCSGEYGTVPLFVDSKSNESGCCHLVGKSYNRKRDFDKQQYNTTAHTLHTYICTLFWRQRLTIRTRKTVNRLRKKRMNLLDNRQHIHKLTQIAITNP